VKIMKKITAILTAFVLMAFAVSSTSAASTLFGSATNEGGYIKAVSDTSVPATPDDDFGGVSFDDANGLMFSELTTLSTDYNVTNDDCGGGSPRFSIRMDTDGDGLSNGSVFVYLGPTPSFTGCTPDTWLSSGNLVGSTDARFDLTQFGGPFYGTYADALALLGSDDVLRISLVVDAGWMFTDQEQTVLFDNTVINGTTYDFTPMLTPTTAEQCKKDGWMTFNAPTFKNQGDCVSYVQSNENAVGNKSK
jgi:hypothetical protein